MFVIGGGPAGLAAAIAARRRGFDVTVADCGLPPVEKACGEGLMPDGLAAARSLGLDLEKAGGWRFDGIRFHDSETSVEAPFPHGHGLGLRRTVLHQAMVDAAAAAGVRLAWGQRIAGIAPEGVRVDGRLVLARWIVGADGGQSMVRRWAGLEAFHRDSRRYGFRRHYRVAPWSDFMELHWGPGCQIYLTPVGAGEVCVVLISSNPQLRLDEVLPWFPEVQRRLEGALPASPERGAVTASRRLRSVWRGNVALIGDASGGVDAITGEGLCLLFQQAVQLAAALETGNLERYQAAHRRIGRRPQLMADLMLLLDRRRGLRGRAIRAMSASPKLFSGMLAMHVGELSAADFVTKGLSLGWRMLIL
jgi:flavin-dependent dehydrogenase